MSGHGYVLEDIEGKEEKVNKEIGFKEREALSTQGIEMALGFFTAQEIDRRRHVKEEQKGRAL